MDFPFGRTVYRQRAAKYWDPVSQSWIEGDWATPEEIELDGAFVAQSSTSRVGDATRTSALEQKSLYCAADADVQLGDRIRVGTSVFPVDGIPASDVNPFTGWQPVREVPLQRAVG